MKFYKDGPAPVIFAHEPVFIPMGNKASGLSHLPSDCLYPVFDSLSALHAFHQTASSPKIQGLILSLLLPLPATLLNAISDALNSAVPLIPSLVLPVDGRAISAQELQQTLQFFWQKNIPFLLLDPSQAPDYSLAPMLKEALGQLKKFPPYRGVYFLDERLLRDDWNAKTENPFSGPKYLDLDISNFCTHNCTFCGLYAPVVAERARQEVDFAQFHRAFTQKKLNGQTVLNFLKQLPLNVSEIQLGGAGDPMAHTEAMAIISAIRKRNIRLSVLTNGAYFRPNDLKALSELSGNHRELHFFINLSAANSHTYQRVRPNQNEASWKKLMTDLPQLTSFTLMNVTTKDNYQELDDFVRLAHALGAADVWIKPLEAHGEHCKDLTVPEEKLLPAVNEAFALADQLGVKVFDRARWHEHGPSAPVLDYYTQSPCRVGLEYMRVTTEEKIYPCCVMGRAVGEIKTEHFWESWLQPAYEDFRQKTGLIHQEHFHLTDPNWAFCRHCPHLYYNQVFEQLQKIPTPPGPGHYFRSLGG